MIVHIPNAKPSLYVKHSIIFLFQHGTLKRTISYFSPCKIIMHRTAIEPLLRNHAHDFPKNFPQQSIPNKITASLLPI